MKPKFTNPRTIRIGLLSAEPIRLAGLASIFDQPANYNQLQFVPVIANLQQLLASPTIEYIVLDLLASQGSLKDLETIRQQRSDIRLIVIGPAGDDELVMNAILAGARAYLDLTADAAIVCKAIGEVTAGSIWAPRRLLSSLIDRLLHVPAEPAANAAGPQLTPREQQVLELILLAHSTREIATQLGIEQRTVKAYVGRLMHKTGVDNRIKLSLSALNHALVPQNPAQKSSMGGGIGNITAR
jgi:DNA-binding NarL/FixJ family response regulator